MTRQPDPLAGLSADEKRAWLSRLLQQREPPRTAPLSFAQRRLWFLDQLMPESAVYNINAALTLNTTLDAVALERSINEIVRRHSALRTTFRSADGEPVQVVAPLLTIDVPVIDLRHLPAELRQPEAQQLATAEARRPFDLASGPLVRTALLRVDEQSHVLLLTLHHIVADGWSMGIFLSELGVLYDAFSAGEPSPLPELPIQYIDFAIWQRSWLKGEVLEEQLAYWKRQLAGVATLQFPTDYPRPAVQTHRGVYHSLSLGRALTRRIREFSNRQRVTPFMTLVAGFKVLLHRYTGQRDIAVGSPIANRTRTGVEPLIGFFVNSLVLRTEVSGEQTFGEVVDRVRQVAIEAYAHQDVPFEMLVEQLQPDRDLSRNPVFQVSFQLFKAPGVDFGGHEDDEWLTVNRGTAIFDLAVHLLDSDEEIAGKLEYSTELFDAPTIARFIDHYVRLLEAAVADPTQRVATLPLLSAQERHQQLVTWNATSRAYPREQCVHTLVEAQVRQRPEAVAVVAGAQTLTYAALNARANQLARYLQRHGVGPDVLVALCVERSVELVVGMLGVLKAGGAYVPLDPSYPPARLAFMLEDTAAPVLLTQAAVRAALPPGAATVLCLDRDWPVVAAESAADLASGVTPEHLAYVIYTSGSTGRPKGVMVPHRALCNHMTWMLEEFSFDASDRILQRTPFSFDASVWEFYAAWLSGATLVLAPPAAHVDPAQLVGVIEREAISVVQVVPSLLRLLLDESAFGRCVTLRNVFCGGEVLPTALVEKFFDLSAADLCNLYGPTEACIDATFHRCPRELASSATVPIGRAIANVRTYVVNRDLNLMPRGIPGELCLAGDALARGYHNQPDQTTSRFVSGPNGERVYRTGDLVRYRHDGVLEFLGRVDRQVKLRGFRIDPAEIEAVLTEHPAIKEAVVVAQEIATGDSRLVAHVVPGPEAGTDAYRAAELVERWQRVYDDAVYLALGRAPADPRFNTVGWNSSYDDQPIPSEHMNEQIGNVVDQLLAMRPQRILEIGCGTGLLLFRLAPHCAEYWATDFSEGAVEYVRGQADAAGLATVRIVRAAADDFGWVGDERFDVIVLNSVVQYFPGASYLLAVVTSAVKALRPGGRIFFGDVRDLRLLRAFHTSVEIARAPGSQSADELRHRVEKRIVEEQELVIDPCFFHQLPSLLRDVRHVAVQPKRGRLDNELNRFRYNVVLYSDDAPAPAVRSVNGEAEALTDRRVQSELAAEPKSTIAFLHVLDPSVARELATVALVAEADAGMTVSDLRAALPEVAAKAMAAETVRQLAADAGYSVEISLSDRPGYFDAVAWPSGSDDARIASVPPRALNAVDASAYTNDPLQGTSSEQLVTALRRFLQTRLPDYMVPAYFEVLTELPKLPNGKIDLGRLTQGGRTRSDLRYTRPRTAIERELAAIWTEVLGVAQVGVHDNFFTELGGHSLLATQLVARIRHVVGASLPLRAVFERPTIAGLAETLATAGPSVHDTTEPPLVALPRAAYDVTANYTSDTPPPNATP